MSPDTFPPLAASQPFANEGTAAGYWETDGPPHLHGFDLEALALQVQARLEKQLRLGKGTDSQPAGSPASSWIRTPGRGPAKVRGDGASAVGGAHPQLAGPPQDPTMLDQRQGSLFSGDLRRKVSLGGSWAGGLKPHSFRKFQIKIGATVVNLSPQP